MRTLYFKVKLLSDVIINQRAATEGNQKTLDFIPGNAFLGVAAGIYNSLSLEEAYVLFHSAKVRFGDAHPFQEGKRTLKVPASWYYKKEDTNKDCIYIHHGLPEKGLKDEFNNPVQLKQCRNEYILKANDKKVSKVNIEKSFAIKSAYDSTKRKSEDAKMFGYESLQAGSEWCFEVVLDDDVNIDIENKLIKALEGKKRIGRSSTAQYGLVKIQRTDSYQTGFKQWDRPKTREIDEPVTFLYAESRLIFLDKLGQPTYELTPGMLGFPEGEILWEMSQIRTFQYAPFNNKRQTRDIDRIGIEKGSVLCIVGSNSSLHDLWVGSYQNEGFGKLLVNPEFLEYLGNQGEANYSYSKETTNSPIHVPSGITIDPDNGSVLKYLKRQSQLKMNQQFIYKHVNDFVLVHAKDFDEGEFASQWGTIRSIAMQFKNPEDLKTEILNGSESYLNHGVAADKWNERGRIKLLERFIEQIEGKNKELLSEAIINLSAQMAKKCRRN